MKILITGGAGFIGSHAAEFFARRGDEVVVFDNLSRAKLLKKRIGQVDYNWNYLKKLKNVKLIKGDVRNSNGLQKASKDCDVLLHAAAQTAVTISVIDPVSDFQANALGTFNVLEAARKNDIKKVLYCSTNKVYGDNVNNVNVVEQQSRYAFDQAYKNGIQENFPIDLCKHTPYGCSKLAGDLYAQDYGKLYGLKTGIFRMSCVYGTRQLGIEDQGWVAWFVIATVLGKGINIYGDGKQVRDVLFVSDLIEIFDKFIKNNLKSGVFNTGGGQENTLSLLELIDILSALTNKKSKIRFLSWRPSDQKVYISDISKARNELNWKPTVPPREGIIRLYSWINQNRELF